MSASNVVKLPRAVKLECSTCGAEGSGSCDCGASYVPARERARAAIAANPGLSDRAIAAEIGTSHQTIMRARRGTGPDGPVEPRTGLDGKTRRLPIRPEVFEAEVQIEACTVECVLEEIRGHWWAAASKDEWLAVAARAYDAGYRRIVRSDLKDYKPKIKKGD